MTEKRGEEEDEESKGRTGPVIHVVRDENEKTLTSRLFYSHNHTLHSH